MGSKKTKKRKRKSSSADQADRHKLYELSVQCPEAELEFVKDTFNALRGRRPKLLREDFCGTAGVCCEWVRQRKTNRAVGIDIDPEVLGWGEKHNVRTLTSGEKKRILLLEENVLSVESELADAILAMNFSYWLFKRRKNLKRYFHRVREGLKDDGVLFLDAYGGYDSFREIEEEREIDGFTYIWDQEKYNPVDGGLISHIHFEFPDGSRLDKAFSYDWRLWTLPEITDLLEEVGFNPVTVYWQGFDEDGEPDGIFKPTVDGDADAGWICYITAEK